MFAQKGGHKTKRNAAYSATAQPTLQPKAKAIVKITEAATARKIEQRHRREPGGATINSSSRIRGHSGLQLGGRQQTEEAIQATNHQQVQAKINAKSKRKN
ncbi:hypothetical protein ACLKA7_009087 [Drosophila subpalustris]